MKAARFNEISFLIIQCAIEVHRTLGPGLLESVYRACLLYELRQRNLSVIAEQIVPICYKDAIIDGWYRLDLLVEDEIIVEIKAVDVVLTVHHAQLLSYSGSRRSRSGCSLTSMSPCSSKASSA